MHIVVTGGAGFIGSNLIRTLFKNDPGVNITCIDNFEPFYSTDLRQLNIRDFKTNAGFHFLYIDIAATTTSELCELIPGEVDVIINMAAKAGVRPSIDNPLAYLQTNIIGLQQMLDFAKEKMIQQFVFASSSSVYGINDHYPWKENEQLLPVSPYAMSKLSGEMLGHVYSKLFGIRFIALRLFTVYGPSQRPDLAIHKFIKAMLKNEPITMYGDGSTSRDYTYVDDIVNGIISATHYDRSNFEIINLGNNYTVSLKELIIILEEITGRKALIEQYPDQPGDVSKTFADISKAKELLGYDPQTDFKLGVKNFYEWFLENKELLLQ